MENNNLLKKLQDYFKTVKEDFSFMKDEIAFTEAIKYLDSEKLKELVNNGFNISEYEKENGSILIKAMYSYSDLLISLLKQKMPKNYIEYYCNQFPRVDDREFSNEMRIELKNMVDSLISVMTVLYNNGASLTKTGVNVDKSSFIGVLTRETENIETLSPFNVAIDLLDYCKTEELVNWFINKKDFNISNEKVSVSKLIRFDSPLSSIFLRKILPGVKLTDYKSASGTNRYSSLHECAVAGGQNTKREKMNDLYQVATPEQRLRYNEDCAIIQSQNNDNIKTR